MHPSCIPCAIGTIVRPRTTTVARMPRGRRALRTLTVRFASASQRRGRLSLGDRAGRRARRRCIETRRIDSTDRARRSHPPAVRTASRTQSATLQTRRILLAYRPSPRPLHHSPNAEARRLTRDRRAPNRRSAHCRNAASLLIGCRSPRSGLRARALRTHANPDPVPQAPAQASTRRISAAVGS